MFGGPQPRPIPPDPDRAVLLRRPLPERLLETVRYLAEEIEPRRVGKLSEAQAAGYLAGRLGRVEQQAVILSFHSDAPPWIALLLILIGMWIALIVPWLIATTLSAALSTLLSGLLTLLFWDELAGRGVLSQALGRQLSQSVVSVRAAASDTPRSRAVLVAPLDGPPRSPRRRLAQAVLLLLLLQALLHSALIFSRHPIWQAVLASCVFTTSLLVASILWQLGRPGPQPATLGAGELAVLLGVAEEIGKLQHTELWIIAAGGGAIGDASLRQVLRRYPFDAQTAIINLDRLTTGNPVFVTREGVLREQRVQRKLLALASSADAHDVRINAEPRPLWRRTLARLPMQRGLATLTITTHSDTPGLASPSPDTLARCVFLVTGMLRELDQTSLDRSDPVA